MRFAAAGGVFAARAPRFCWYRHRANPQSFAHHLPAPDALTNVRRVIVIVMGVAGCGKTTVGRLLAKQLGWEFLDADWYHPPANIAKMQAGTPLGDADRVVWLGRMRREIEDRLARGRSAVLACSALREGYRRELRHPGEPIQFVYLRGDFATIHARLVGRTDHYMPAALLGTQFETLEEPEDALVVPVELSPEDAVETIMRALGRAATNAGQATTPRPHGS